MANNAPKSLTSDDVNYLIYRYLQESGFHHAAFTFAHESQVHRTDIDPDRVAAGALVTLIQKGLQYLEVEANLDGDEVDEDFHLLDPVDLLCAEVDDLRQLVLEKKAEAEERAGEAKAAAAAADRGHRKRDRQEEAANAKQQREQQQQQQQQGAADGQQQSQQASPLVGRGKAANKQAAARAAAAARGEAAAEAKEGGAAAASSKQDKVKVKQEQQEQQQSRQRQQQQQAAADGDSEADGAVPMDEDTPNGGGHSSAAVMGCEITNVRTLKGHQSEVFMALWNPAKRLLATGSSDSTARIWDFTPGANPSDPVLLVHMLPEDEAHKDVTTLDWAPDGTRLASGTYDGVVRIWDCKGNLQRTLRKHTGPIFSLKWSKRGELLLTGSVDNMAVVWDVKQGVPQQVFSFHTAPCLDGDWRDDTTFATCSSDKSILVCRLGDTSPYRTFTGHTNEVNAVRWDPSCRLLASCSDDTTAKVWSLEESSSQPVHDFTEHDKEIYTIRWSPTGPDTSKGHLPLLLATASFDASVKLWDVEAGRCYHTLDKHTEPIYSVSFSPDGRLMASGSFDKHVHIWDVASGRLVRSHEGQGGIFEVCWSNNGDQIAASFNDNTVHVLDVRTWQRLK